MDDPGGALARFSATAMVMENHSRFAEERDILYRVA
jgi:hypothetical protein